MIITKTWLQEWIDISSFSTDEICKTLNNIGLEVDSVISYKMPDNCVVGYVISKQKHPNADKLSVCQIDVGESSPLQIVCGAPNVDVNQYVAVALSGAVLPNNLKIKKVKIRDIESNGMICSSTELGLPKINDGIMILNSLNPKIGTRLSDIDIFNDDVIEIELTANKGDCLSIHGVARDLSAALKLKVKKLKEPKEDTKQMGIGRVLNLSVENSVNSSLEYKAVEPHDFIEDVTIDIRVALIGIVAQNKFEKLLAYSTHATGVILRAYNKEVFEKTEDNRINVIAKKDKNGFDAIFSKDVLSYVGISQEENSKASEKNSTVVLEASYAEPEYIASNKAKNIKNSDNALYRSLRGSEPDISLGLTYLVNLLQKTSKTAILMDSQKYIKDREVRKISANFDDIFSIIGKKIDKNEVIDILNRLSFKTFFNIEQNEIWIDIPSFRHDVVNIQDICEEIVRIVGIDNIPSKPLIFAEKNRLNKAMIDFEKRKFYRYKAAAAGFNECVHYVFDDRDRIESYGFKCVYEDKDIVNPITTELNTLRVNLGLNLLNSITKNLNAGKKSVCLFEIGRVFDENRDEKTNIAFVTSGFCDELSVLNSGKPKEFDFFTFAKKLKQAIGDFDIKKATPKETLFSPYEYGEIIINNEVVGIIARVNVENCFELDKAYICELDFEKLFYARKIATAYSKLPSVSRDLSLLVSKNTSFDEIKQCINDCNIKELSNFYAIDTYSDEALKEKISLTISFNFQPLEKSFSDEDINKIIEKILRNLEEKLNIFIR